METKGRVTLNFIRRFYKDHRAVTAELMNKYGTKFALKGYTRNLHFFADPKFICHILFTNSPIFTRTPNPIFDTLDNPKRRLKRTEINERWKKMRSKLFNPAMTDVEMRKKTEIIVEGAKEHLAKWEKAYIDGKTPFKIYPLIQRVTYRNLCKALLGDIKLDEKHVIETIDDLAELELSYELSISKLAWKLPTKTRSRTRDVMRRLDKINDQIIKYCLSDKIKDVTIFRDLVRDFPADYNLYEKEEDLRVFLQSICGIFTIAGFDSISHALPMSFAYVSQFPEIADKIRQDVKTHIGDGDITHDNVDLLAYTRAVFMEGLRFSGGIFPLLVRQAVQDDEIDGYKIKKRDKIIIPVHYTTRLAQYWENPEGFNPDRFLSINTLDDKFRFAHLTFGAGINSCAGRHYAILQCTILLAMAVSKFRFDLTPNQKIHPDHPQQVTFTLHKP